jgi:hypothetical protein
VVAAVPKPDYIFDRDSERRTLAEFATDERQGATLGVVSGRRRQGKTLLLESMCEELGGHSAEAPALRRGRLYSRAIRWSGGQRWQDPADRP